MGLDQPLFFWESHSFEAIFDEIVDNPFDTVVAFAFFTTLLTVESVGLLSGVIILKTVRQ